MKQLPKVLNQLEQVTSARFASLTYRSKGTNELARHTILLGVDTLKAYKKDLAKLLILQPRLEGVKQLACQELIKSIKQSLDKGIGQNEAYTCKDVYEQTTVRGVKVHKETNELHLMGYAVSKVVIEQGEEDTTKSSEKTLAKHAISKHLRRGKIRQFVLSLDTLQDVRINGKEIEFI